MHGELLTPPQVVAPARSLTVEALHAFQETSGGCYVSFVPYGKGPIPAALLAGKPVRQTAGPPEAAAEATWSDYDFVQAVLKAGKFPSGRRRLKAVHLAVNARLLEEARPLMSLGTVMACLTAAERFAAFQIVQLAPSPSGPSSLQSSSLSPHVELSAFGIGAESDRRQEMAALTLTVADLTIAPWDKTSDHEAVLEAIAAYEGIEDASAFEESAFWTVWREEVTRPPPKQSERFLKADFTYATLSAVEVFWMARLTQRPHPTAPVGSSARKRQAEKAGDLQFHLSRFKHLLVAMRQGGSRFANSDEDMLNEWLARIRFPRAYRPGGSIRAPLAFLLRAFKFALDKEKRRVGSELVSPRWIRAMKSAGKLLPDQPLDVAFVRSQRADALARMKHAPPPGFISTSQLATTLSRIQGVVNLARAVDENPDHPDRAEYVTEIAEDEDLGRPLMEWLQDAGDPARPALPPLYIPASAPLKQSSVYKLLRAYEKVRGSPFPRTGSARVIPQQELVRIIQYIGEGEVRRRAKPGP